jgi:hypothetical protein
MKGRRCTDVCDEILSRAVDPEAAPLSSESSRHLEDCPDCRDFAKAWPVVSRLGMTWRAPEPPPGLAFRTIERLRPEWREKERPIGRHEVRLLWSSGLAMAGSLVAILLMVADRIFPMGGSVQFEALARLGVQLAFFQFAGAALVSLVVLAFRASRSSKRQYRRRDSRWRGGD